MCEYDKREVEQLIAFANQLKQQLIEEKNLSYEEKIKKHLATWRGEDKNVGK